MTVPKKSNWKEFEELISWINTCLVGKGKVEHNVKIPDKDTGQSRQIDILITLDSGPYLTTIMVEVRNQKQRVDVTYIEEIASKRDSIRAAQAAIVSKSGFTDSALIKAETLGIKTFTYIDALKLDWCGWLAEKYVHYDNHVFQIININFIAPPSEKGNEIPGSFIRTESLKIGWKELITNPNEFLAFYFNEKPEVVSSLPENGQFVIGNCTIKLNDDFKIYYKNKSIKLDSINIEYKHRREVGVQPFSYSILSSEGKTIGEVVSADIPTQNSKMKLDLLSSPEGDKRKISSRMSVNKGIKTYGLSVELKAVEKKINVVTDKNKKE
ncbi:MAG: hypothetical protein C4542_08710 [Dehalococcoidia bacterium]|nr:MAG: hypothetical protein C4542_08710 [Dehalococcoidia bacterium]